MAFKSRNKKFGNKVYMVWYKGLSKRDADSEAKKLRSDGRTARVVKEGVGYSVYMGGGHKSKIK